MSLLLSADTVAESSLQTELMEIQERWRHAHHRLDQQRRELQGLIKVRSLLIPRFFWLINWLCPLREKIRTDFVLVDLNITMYVFVELGAV